MIDSIGRLKGRAIVAESNIAVAQKRLDDFERSKHLCNVEIDGEQWSLVRLDGQQRTQERQIHYSRRTVSAYRTRLYGAINNPLKLYGLHNYKENATNAKAQIKESQRRIEDIQNKRYGVTSLLEKQRAMLHGDLMQKTESAQELKHTFDLEIHLKLNPGEAIPQPAFTGKELDRLEANAKILRDPTMLKTVYEQLERRYGTTTHGVETIAARANETLESTNEWLANLNEQIQSFIENPEFSPVLFSTTNAGEQTATLHELAKPLGENVAGRIFSDPRSDHVLEEALNQHYADLQQDRNAIEHFARAISDLVDSYRKQIVLNGREFTESESLALRLPFDTSGPISPATAGFRSDTADLNDPTHTRGLKEGMATTPQPYVASHLEQIRQAIDHVAAQNGASNENIIETGIAETESVTSESMAILL